MIKRTLYFGNPCYLKIKNAQLVLEYPKNEAKIGQSLPIEDIGIMILDHPQITITQGLIAELNKNNTIILSCDSRRLPYGLMLPIFSHHAFTEKMQQQLECTLPLKKNLWQQTIKAKIANQAALLKKRGHCDKKLQIYFRMVKSGDPENVEGRAAAYYWDTLFGQEKAFTRHRYGDSPNDILNYGYAILLSIVARSLVSSGLLPAAGIHHHNKYNPWCLASDVMEPFRPYVDQIVIQIYEQTPDVEELNTSIKKQLLRIPVTDILIEKKSSPLMVGVQRTTASLSACFAGTSRKILYPEFQ